MDSWSDKQINMMRAGGNQKLIDWFQSHGVTSDQRIAKKYHSPAAELFRDRCKKKGEKKRVRLLFVKEGAIVVVGIRCQMVVQLLCVGWCCCQLLLEH